MTDTVEQTARRIADRGRDELVARLRPAFQEAAREHAELLELSDEQLEQEIQRSADRADGLQWRRALAGVASEELGITLGEAIAHPAVARAQSMLGVPPYEDSVAELKGSPREDAPPAGGGAEPEAAAQDGDGTAETVAYRPTISADAEREAKPAPADDGWLRLQVVHLGGIANLESAEGGIELRLSVDGLDIARAGDQVLGRLRWPEINVLDVPQSRSLRRRRRAPSAQLVIRTDHGDASFEVPEVSPEELEAQLAPLLARYANPDPA